MINPEKTQDLLPESLRRLDALACLHPTTKASLHSWLTSQATQEQIAAWRDKNLAFLERWIAPVSAPSFADLCQRLNHFVAWETLRHALRLPDGATPSDWVGHAIFHRLSSCECLWCLAQQLGLPEILDAAQKEAVVRTLLSDSVRFLGFPQTAVAVLEEFIPITEADYAGAESLSRCLQRFASERQLDGNNAARYVRSLADALRSVSRPRQAVLGLEAFVPLTEADYADTASLSCRLQRFADERHLEGNTAASYVRALAYALPFVDRPRHAVLALEAFVPLTEADYADAESLRGCLERFASERQLTGNTAAAYVLSLADALRFVSRPRQAALALEAYVPLTEADYANAESLRGCLERFASERQVESNNAAVYVQMLAEALRIVNRPRQAVLALEAFVPLTEADYADTESLRGRLERFASERQLEPNTVASHVRVLAEALVQVGRPRQAALVLEAFVPLTEADYADAESLSRRLRRFASERQLAGTIAAVYVQTLAEALGLVNRPRQAALALEAFVPLTEADYANAESLRGCLKRFASEWQLTGNNAAYFVQGLADALRSVNRPRQAALALEAFVPLTKADYADPESLSRRLQRFASERQLEGNNAALYVRALAGALRSVNRPRQAALALEAFVPITEADYADAESLRGCLERFASERQLAGNSAALYVQMLAEAQRFVDRPRQAGLVLEAFIPLTEADYADAESLRGRLERFASERELEGNNAAMYVRTLAEALVQVGRPRQAALALEAFTHGFTFLEAADSSLSAGSAADLVSARLRCGFEDSGEGARLLERFIAWLQNVLRNTPPADKAQLMENIADVRRQGIAFADAQAQRAGSTTESARWRKRGLVWDAWLGQRVLMERMLIGREMHSSSDSPTTPKAMGWPYLKEPRRPSWTGHRPKRRSWTSATSANVRLDVEPATTSLAEEAPEGQPLPARLARSTTPEVWQARARERLNAPFGERELAADLGQATLLLRAGIGPEGGLHWSAWQAEDTVMRLIAHEDRPGQPTDRRRLAWAQRRHDLRIALAYVEGGPREMIAKILDDISFHCLGRDSLDERLETLKLGLLTFLDNVTANRILRIVSQAVQADRSREEDDVLAEEWPQLVKAARPTSLGVVDDLHAATADLITEAGRIWDLSPLEGRLDGDLDVVLVADDVLHGLPFAHLCVGKRPLFTQVRSTRSSLSLVLDAIQKDIENTSPAEFAPRLSGAAWVAPGDAARQGGVEFLHGLSNLAHEFGHDLSLAADMPAADLAWLLRQPVQDGPARIFGWYGHGHEEQAGIFVGPARPGTVCKGDGMRLELFELMLVIACSLGRHRQTGTLDAESFCCDLTLNGMRSAVAARWPVHAEQAADVGNEIARQYLLLRRDLPRGGGDLTRARIRARAVNLARDKLLAIGSDYLNTLAAFELWGLA